MSFSWAIIQQLSVATLRRPQVFEPPDILYWARGNDNSTVYDKLGLPWYCYTLQQTHCVPLFKTPANYRTTRRPAQKVQMDERQTCFCTSHSITKTLEEV